MKSSHIIHIITTIERGGAEKQLLVLAREQVKIGYSVEIIYLKGEPELKDLFERNGCLVNSFLVNMPFYKQVFFLSKKLSQGKNIVHAHLPQAELVTALSSKKKSFVFTRHNSEQFWPSGPKYLSILLSRIVCYRASSGIAISKAVKEFVISRKEVPRSFNIDVIYYGFDSKIKVTSIGLEDISKKLPNYSKTKIVGAIGRLVDQKNFPTLLHAFSQSLITNRNIHLVIVGNGKNEKELKDLANKLEISGRITWLGRTAYISEFLSKIDIFVLPSNYEGFGLVLLEAMVANKPILASNNSSIPEVLGVNYRGLFETGNISELSSKLNDLLLNSNYRKTLIKGYSSRLKLFNSKIMAGKIAKFYSSTLELSGLKLNHK